MQLTPCLVFDGDCRAAFEHYAAVLGGEITAMIANKDMPGNDNPWAEARPDKIVHAWLQIGDQAMMGNDSPPEYVRPMSGFSIGFHADAVGEARRVFDALSEGGEVSMPFGEQPWSRGFGMLTDRFGTPWLIDTRDVQA
jgi:PhnB protein